MTCHAYTITQLATVHTNSARPQVFLISNRGRSVEPLGEESFESVISIFLCATFRRITTVVVSLWRQRRTCQLICQIWSIWKTCCRTQNQFLVLQVCNESSVCISCQIWYSVAEHTASACCFLSEHADPFRCVPSCTFLYLLLAPWCRESGERPIPWFCLLASG